MRTFFTLLGLLLILSACDERNSAKSNASTDSKSTLIDSTELTVKPSVDSNFKLQLIPMEIVDSTKTDPFEKYGYHFSGHCYACDVAEIFIHKGKIMLVNVCDKKKVDEFEIRSMSITSIQIDITTTKYSLSLKKVEGTPVYELICEGKLAPVGQGKLVQFYASKKDLARFKVHECGDFGG